MNGVVAAPPGGEEERVGGPTRLVFIGGGPAALAAAYSLTSNEPGRYEITIYEMSWRLGGKTASGRDSQGRIEEHGLHILFGCYHNVFRLLRTCYDELREKQIVSAEQHEFQHFFDAIQPCHEGVIGDDRTEPWQRIDVQFPSNRGVPGDPPLPGAWDLTLMLFQLGWIVVVGPKSLRHVQRCLPWLFDYRNRWKREEAWEEDDDHKVHPDRRHLGGSMLSRGLLKLAKNMLDNRRFAGKASHVALVRGHAAWHGLRAVIKPIVARFEVAHGGQLPFSRLWSAVDFFFALSRGLIKDRVLVELNGFEHIDGYDLRDWLKAHDAGESTLGSPWMRIIYDAAFSYLEGDARRENVAAGAAVRALLLMTITYKGCFYNKMEAGMGDVVHTPLYLVLKNRGVRFEFFHRLTDLRPGEARDGGSIVDEIVFDALPEQEAAYDPLVPVGKLLCWPSDPKLEHIAAADHRRAGEAESYACVPGRRVTRKHGTDFDAVVLGVPVKCLPFACPSLLAAERQRTDGLPSLHDQAKIDTVQTIALQLWLKPSLNELGWKDTPPLLSLFMDPLNTWCDMSHLLSRESWPHGRAPGTLAYFCGPLPHAHAFPRPEQLAAQPGLSTEIAREIREQIELAARELLDQHLQLLLPTVRGAPGFNYALLLDHENRKGKDRFDAQYVRANYEPHQLCTLAVAGKTELRMRTDETGYDNLFVTGDWINNGVYLACVEGAVHSGLRTARAVSARFGDHPEKYSIVAEELLNLQVVSPKPEKPTLALRKA